MSKDEKARLANEVLEVRQAVENLYQSAYNAFVASTNEFAKMMMPVMKQQVEMARRLIRLEDKIYKAFEKEKDDGLKEAGASRTEPIWEIKAEDQRTEPVWKLSAGDQRNETDI